MGLWGNILELTTNWKKLIFQTVPLPNNETNIFLAYIQYSEQYFDSIVSKVQNRYLNN